MQARERQVHRVEAKGRSSRLVVDREQRTEGCGVIWVPPHAQDIAPAVDDVAELVTFGIVPRLKRISRIVVPSFVSGGGNIELDHAVPPEMGQPDLQAQLSR